MTEGPQPPMTLGDVLELSEFRAAAHTLLTRRTAANKAAEAQGLETAKARAKYEEVKAARWMLIKHEGGTDGGAVSAAEAEARVKGDPAVQVSHIGRDAAEETLRARRQDIDGLDEALATLRKVGEWSMQLEARGV